MTTTKTEKGPLTVMTNYSWGTQKKKDNKEKRENDRKYENTIRKEACDRSRGEFLGIKVREFSTK